MQRLPLRVRIILIVALVALAIYAMARLDEARQVQKAQNNDAAEHSGGKAP